VTGDRPGAAEPAPTRGRLASVPTASPSYPTPTNGRLFLRGLLKHCPVCGKGHLFRRWFTMLERCPRCGLRFQRIEGHWTGDLGINVIISFGALLITLFVSFAVSYPNPGLWMFPLAVAVALLVPLIAYPFSKTIWLAIDVMMRPVEPEELADP
jgi:uncharacterized protein (DUF983 family)